MEMQKNARTIGPSVPYCVQASTSSEYSAPSASYGIRWISWGALVNYIRHDWLPFMTSQLHHTPRTLQEILVLCSYTPSSSRKTPQPSRAYGPFQGFHWGSLEPSHIFIMTKSKTASFWNAIDFGGHYSLFLLIVSTYHFSQDALTHSLDRQWGFISPQR